MQTIFGHYQASTQQNTEYLVLVFSPSSSSIKERWRNNGLSADFLAGYMASFFPGQDVPGGHSQQHEIKAAVSYIANELLENAMKFSDSRSAHPIRLKLELLTDRIIFTVTNSLVPETIAPLQGWIEKLLSQDPADLYVQQVEKSVDNETEIQSGLGLITMMMDYDAELGWKFEHPPNNPSGTTITTMVQISV